MVIWTCSSTNDSTSSVPNQLLPRSAYDTSRPFKSLIKPHFFATTRDGTLVEAVGYPDLLVVRHGKAKIRLRNGSAILYLDPLALVADMLGEHPVHKLYRLNAMGIPLAAQLEEMLHRKELIEALFYEIKFEYLRSKNTASVIVDVFRDGSFLTIPTEVPPEWQSSTEDIASPTHFHVDPRALSIGASDLAHQFETEVLALPFDDQRYLPTPLAHGECEVYKESVADKNYTRVLSSVGYRFSRDHVFRYTEDPHASIGKELWLSLHGASGKGVRYFGFSSYWVAERLTALEISWVEECDTAGQLRRFRHENGAQEHFYITLRSSLEPDKTQRYKIVKIDDNGSGQVTYNSPGIILMAHPINLDDDLWIMSAEGWKPPDGEAPPDPRWQSVYTVDMKNPERYHIVQYPLQKYISGPQHGFLYGSSAATMSSGTFLLSLLYGFKNEGGGLWITDISSADFYRNTNKFSRIAAWDHALSWMVLENAVEGPSSNMSIFLTGKEVADDFSMTANLLQIQGKGLEANVVSTDRLLRMVGWNPVPIAIQRQGTHEFIVAVGTHYNYEASLLPRAKGVYLLPIKTGRGN